LVFVYLTDVKNVNIDLYLTDTKHYKSMKTTFCSIITILFLSFVNMNESFAQQINPKIQEVYGIRTQEILQNDPERIKILNDLLDNRIKFVESPAVGEDKYTKLLQNYLQYHYNTSITPILKGT
jgi:hypothetical protein